jgi:hypothetical protein
VSALVALDVRDPQSVGLLAPEPAFHEIAGSRDLRDPPVARTSGYAGDPGAAHERRADQLEGTPAVDHALVAGIAALNAIPVIGGVVATFISEYIPRRKQARLVGFVQDLGRQFDAERERIDADFVRSSEFDRMVEDVLDRVQQVKNEEKLGYWAALLAGVATRDRPAQSDRERMIETLDGVRASNLRLLHVIATTRQGPPELT